MIPFKLFKYIFFRYILYGIIYNILPIIIISGLYTLHLLLSKTYISDTISILSVLVISFMVVYVLKLILNKIIFYKYDKIKIITDLKEINDKFLFKIIGMRTIACTITELLYIGICYLLFGKYHDYANILSILPCGVVEYFVLNWLLSKYINVIPNEKSVEDNSDVIV